MKKLNEYIESNSNIFIFPWECDYQTEYNANKAIINIILKNKYGELPLVSDDFNDINSLIQGTLLINQYKINTLWESTKFVYNPIWNVEGEETTETIYGEHKTVMDKGQVEVTNEYGQQTNTEKEYVFPFDSDEKTQANENSVIMGKDNDTTTTKPITDTSTSQTHTDKVTVKRQGNIGVTSTQSLITQQREVADFSFWNEVIKIVAKEITIPYYKEVENDCTNWYY